MLMPRGSTQVDGTSMGGANFRPILDRSKSIFDRYAAGLWPSDPKVRMYIGHAVGRTTLVVCKGIAVTVRMTLVLTGMRASHG